MFVFNIDALGLLTKLWCGLQNRWFRPVSAYFLVTPLITCKHNSLFDAAKRTNMYLLNAYKTLSSRFHYMQQAMNRHIDTGTPVIRRTNATLAFAA